MLWKVCAQDRHAGFFVSEKKSSLTMKEGLDEVARPDLSDNCLQRSNSKFFQSFALDLYPESKKVTNARVQEDDCFSSPTPPRFMQTAVQSNRFFFFFGGGGGACLQNEIAPEKLLNRYEKQFEKREKKI